MRHPKDRELRKWRRENRYILPTSESCNSVFGSRIWYDECGGKIAHFDEDSAMQQITEISVRPLIHNNYGRKLTIYRCSWCDWFHIGHECQRGKNNVIYTHWC